MFSIQKNNTRKLIRPKLDVNSFSVYYAGNDYFYVQKGNVFNMPFQKVVIPTIGESNLDKDIYFDKEASRITGPKVGYIFLTASFSEGSPAELVSAEVSSGEDLPEGDECQVIVPIASYSITNEYLAVVDQEVKSDIYIWKPECEQSSTPPSSIPSSSSIPHVSSSQSSSSYSSSSTSQSSSSSLPPSSSSSSSSVPCVSMSESVALLNTDARGSVEEVEGDYDSFCSPNIKKVIIEVDTVELWKVWCGDELISFKEQSPSSYSLTATTP